MVAPCFIGSFLLINCGAAERTLGVPKGKFGGPPKLGGGPGSRSILGGAGGILGMDSLGGGKPGGGPGGIRGLPGGGPGGSLKGAPLVYISGGGMGGCGCCCGCCAAAGTGSVPGGIKGSVECAFAFLFSSSLLLSVFFWTVSISFMNSSTFCPESATIFCCNEVGFTVVLLEASVVSSCVDDCSSVASSCSS